MRDLLLQTLHELAPAGEPVALTRLAKRLDQRVSVLLRELTALSDARIAGEPRNPFSIAMPAALPVAKQDLPAFLAHAAPLQARLDLIANSALAQLE